MSEQSGRFYEIKQWLIAGFLAATTWIATTFAGAEWVYGGSIDSEGTLIWKNLDAGSVFSSTLLGILLVHELGHYLTAKYYRVKVSPPFFLPLWLGWLGIPTLGTLGAFIRIREQVSSQRQLFDIGVAGPLAGLFAAIMVLVYAFSNLPDLAHLFAIHPEYKGLGSNYPLAFSHMSDNVAVFATGNNLLFLALGATFADPNLMPHSFELQHYPLLFAGYWSLVFTSINLLPIGQLDGGHVLYGLVGERKHRHFSLTFFLLFLLYAGMNTPTLIDVGNNSQAFDAFLSNLLYLGFLIFVLLKSADSLLQATTWSLGLFFIQYCQQAIGLHIAGFSGWLGMAFVIGRFLGTTHPPAYFEEGLNTGRKVVGWIALLFFVLCFTPQPMDILSAQQVRAMYK